ncbi:hypothetical protein PENTCL1PPCAC_27875, partial [Pristionchus entomophagus]
LQNSTMPRAKAKARVTIKNEVDTDAVDTPAQNAAANSDLTKLKSLAPIKVEIPDEDTSKEQIASSSSSSSTARGSSSKKGPLPTKKFSGPLPPEEEIKLPQKPAPKKKAAPKAKAAAPATPKGKEKSEPSGPSPRRNSLADRELAGLMTEQSSMSEGKRVRPMSEAALLRLAAELDAAEMREINKQKKALEEEMRQVRAISVQSPPLSPVASPAKPSSAKRARSKSPPAQSKKETAKPSKAPASFPPTQSKKPSPVKPAKPSKAAAPAAAVRASAAGRSPVRSPPRARSILRDDKSAASRAKGGGKRKVSFGGDEVKGGDASEKSQLEMDDTPAPPPAKGAKGAKAAAIRAATAAAAASSSSTAAAAAPKRAAKAAASPAAKKKKASEEGEATDRNSTRREAMKDSQQIVDECPSCRIPLITNPVLKSIDVDTYEDREIGKVARPHINKKTCVGQNGMVTNTPLTSDGTISARNVDVWSSLRRRLIEKFDITGEIGDEYYIPDTKRIALRNQYLTPDIIMAPSDFQRATFDLPTRSKNLVCSYPTWAKDAYFRLRKAYERQVEIMIEENGGPSTSSSFSSNLTVTHPTRIRCHCDKYNLLRCGDKKSACCNSEMLQMEARFKFNESDTEE